MKKILWGIFGLTLLLLSFPYWLFIMATFYFGNSWDPSHFIEIYGLFWWYNISLFLSIVFIPLVIATLIIYIRILRTNKKSKMSFVDKLIVVTTFIISFFLIYASISVMGWQDIWRVYLSILKSLM